MCGISGIVNFNDQAVSTASLQKMMSEMKHRGPDDEGAFSENGIGLGFVRLSILDLSMAGHQPMFSHNERYVIIFNGEVYNFIELKKELSRDFTFKSNSDTEVILAAYQKWGEAFQHKMNGMWGIAIYDREEKSLFISRDRYGIKPVYYTIQDNRFIFASEFGPILSTFDRKPEPNDQIIFDYLTFNRTNHSQDTFFKGIQKLQHGHCMTIKNGEINIRRWYNLEDQIDQPFQSGEAFRETLESAIQLRMRSDVPVGACLSGGLDSATIVSLIQSEEQFKNLHTFSAVYGKGQPGDESGFIDEFRTQVKNMHFIEPSAESLFNDLPHFVRALEEPVPTTSIYALFRVMELAKGKVTVLQNGQGADELLAGYDYFFGFLFKELITSYRWGTLINEVGHYGRKHQSAFALKYLVFLMLPTALKLKSRVASKSFINQDFSRRFEQNTNNVLAAELYGSKTLKDALINHFEYKFEHMLIWGDHCSMWHSLEVRFPFLDNRLVEKTLSLPLDKVMHKGMTKYILRKAMKDVIPEKIRTRMDKMGFSTPEANWFRNEPFRGLIEGILNSSTFRERGYIDVDKARHLYQSHLKGERDISRDIWKWIHLEKWFEKYID